MKLAAFFLFISIIAGAVAVEEQKNSSSFETKMTIPATPAATPVPIYVPVLATPEAIQDQVLKWIMAATAIFSAVVAFATFVITKMGELKRQLASQKEELTGRLDRQGSTIQNQQAQIATIAVATPGQNLPSDSVLAPKPLITTENASTSLQRAAIACLGALFLMGCATEPKHCQCAPIYLPLPSK